MADKLIGSLIYDDHPVPKKARPWKDQLKVPIAIALVLGTIGFLLWRFANYREERVVTAFLESLQSRQYESAFQNWDAGESYRLKDFLEDWGDKGYYGHDLAGYGVVDSNTKGTWVVVYVARDARREVPIALMVDKQTHKLSFSPINKFR